MKVFSWNALNWNDTTLTPIMLQKYDYLIKNSDHIITSAPDLNDLCKNLTNIDLKNEDIDCIQEVQEESKQSSQMFEWNIDL